MVIHGNDCFLSYKDDEGAWHVFGGEKSSALSCDTDLQETASPTSGNWREYLPKKSGWAIQFNGLLLDTSVNPFMLWKGRKKLEIQMKIGGTEVTGAAYITRVNSSAAQHEVGQMSVDLTGSGGIDFQ